MAKTLFQRNQRVWVDSVGAWAVVEKIEPVWAKGFDEPIKVTYDVGLGRPFASHELTAEDPVGDEGEKDAPGWRLMRARNKWQTTEECAQHPYPGTFPVVVTDATDWGGWRTPGAEYDRDPRRIEAQARLISQAPALRRLVKEMLMQVAEAPDDAPPAMVDFARKAAAIERYLAEVPAAPDAGAAMPDAAE